MLRHPMNQAFDWQDRKEPFRLLSSEQAAQYNESGFLLFEDVFDARTVGELLEELDPIEALGEQLLREHFNGKAFIARADEITFTPHLVTRSPRARRLTQAQFFRDLAHDLLGQDVRLYWDQTVYKKPRTPDDFPWHQDNGYTFVDPQQYLTCWVALTDADQESGCPVVIPGAHKNGTYSHDLTDLGYACIREEPENAVAVPVRAGGVVVFSSLTPHKTGPNVTMDHTRKAYVVQFAPDGASLLQESRSGQWSRTSCDAADRQYPILIKGEAPA